MAQLNKHSALPLKAQNKGSKMKIEELVIFFSISASFLQLILKTTYSTIWKKNILFPMYEFAQQKGVVSWNISKINCHTNHLYFILKQNALIFVLYRHEQFSDSLRSSVFHLILSLIFSLVLKMFWHSAVKFTIFLKFPALKLIALLLL